MTDRRWPIEEALSHSYELSNIKVHGIAAHTVAALKEIRWFCTTMDDGHGMKHCRCVPAVAEMCERALRMEDSDE